MGTGVSQLERLVPLDAGWPPALLGEEVLFHGEKRVRRRESRLCLL